MRKDGVLNIGRRVIGLRSVIEGLTAAQPPGLEELWVPSTGLPEVVHLTLSELNDVDPVWNPSDVPTGALIKKLATLPQFAFSPGGYDLCPTGFEVRHTYGPRSHKPPPRYREYDSDGVLVRRRCSGCHRVLTSDEFHSDRSAVDGHSTYCKRCARENKLYRWPVPKTRQSPCRAPS